MMAYAKSGSRPWHGLGNPVDDTLTPEQIGKAAGLDWTVSKRRILFEGANGTPAIPLKNRFVLARDTDDQQLSIVSSVYKPVQNATALKFFKRFCEAGHMKMETAGSLEGGRYIWALAKIAKGFKLGKNDNVESYLLLCQPHVVNRSFLIQTTAIRVVCWNTLTYALGSNLKGSASAFRMPHSTEFTPAVAARAEQALGLAAAQMDEFHEAATLLASKQASAAATENFFCDVLSFDPEEAMRVAEKERVKFQEPANLLQFRHALNFAPGQDLATARGTWWGAVNAVTYVVDHAIGRNRDTALSSAWLGERAGMKRKAVNLALDRAFARLAA